jgi:hypothetical protein
MYHASQKPSQGEEERRKKRNVTLLASKTSFLDEGYRLFITGCYYDRIGYHQGLKSKLG